MNTITFTPDQLCALEQMAVLHIHGPDARSFMQAQLTNPVQDLEPNQATFAGFCQAKGRLQATMMLWVDPQNPENLYALLHRSIAETVRKRLSMFLLRAKAELVFTTAKVYGVFAANMPAVQLPSTHYAVSAHHAGTLIRAPSATSAVARAWLISYDNNPLEATNNAEQWQAADIQAGLPWVQEASYEAFLPQDVNLDIIGAVSFKKGCFPGQEVVARLHYRTTAKRRGALGVIASDQPLDIAIGSDIFTTEQPNRPLGRVINSAYDSQAQQQTLLMEVLIDGITEKTLYTNCPKETKITLQALPFGWEIAKY